LMLVGIAHSPLNNYGIFLCLYNYHSKIIDFNNIIIIINLS
jgi:hypothetical protein